MVKQYTSINTMIEDLYLLNNHYLSIKGAQQELLSSCKKALLEKYGEFVPDLIKKRYESELRNIISHEFESYYVLAAMVVEKCKELGYLYDLRSFAGGSLIVYLMGITEINPLPPHYYCPECKRVEFVDALKYPSGFDLNCYDSERKYCPDCGEPLFGDGHNIPVEFFAGPSGNKFPDFKFDVFKDGLTDLSHSNSMLVKLKLMEKLTGVSNESIKFDSIDIFTFFMDDNFYGLPFDADFAREISDKVYPVRFSDLVKISGIMHGANVWTDNGEELAGTVCYPEELIAHPDDLMLMLVQHGVERETAFLISDIVRKGKVATLLKSEHEKLLRDCGIPEWYIDSMKKIEYLFPKSRSTEYMINCLRMIWYKIYHPVEFYAAVHSNDK